MGYTAMEEEARKHQAAQVAREDQEQLVERHVSLSDLAVSAPEAPKAPASADLQAFEQVAFADDPKPAAEAQEAPGADLPHYCARCGWASNADGPSMPTDEDKAEFVRSILGERRYEQSVTLLGGKMVVHYRLITVEEQEALMTYMAKAVERSKCKNDAEWQVQYLQARLVCMLSKLTLGDNTKVYPALDLQAEAGGTQDNRIAVAVDRVMRGWPVSVQGLLVRAMEDVDSTYATLMARGHDPDFWVAAAE